MEQEVKKPDILKGILILTFIGSGLTLFSNLFIFTLFHPIKAMLEAQGYSYTFMGSTMDLTPFFKMSPAFYLIQALLSGFSLTGTFLMWNLKKVGFHFYALAQIMMLIVPELFVRGLPFPGMEVLITATFIYFYSRFLRFMS
jgi:hypothetical protein